MYSIFNYKNIKKLINATIIIIALSFCTSSVLISPKINTGILSGYNILSSILLMPSHATIAVNRLIVKKEINTKKTEVPFSENNRKKESGKNPFFFMIIGTFSVAADKLLWILAFFAMLLLPAVSNKRFFLWGNIIPNGPPDRKDTAFYRMWCYRFITPVQKCIENLSEKYDINPIFMVGRGNYEPALCVQKNIKCGFFLCLSRRIK